MLSKGSDSVPSQPETGAVAPAQDASSSLSSRWRWVLYATAGIALVLAWGIVNLLTILPEP